MDKIINIISFCLVLLFSFFFYTNLTSIDVATDLEAHSRMIVNAISGEASFPPNFLYYLLVALLAGFKPVYEQVYQSSIYVISLAVALKFTTGAWCIRAYWDSLSTKPIKGKQWKSNLLSLCLLFCFALPNLSFFQTGYYYLGQMPPNTWHNSTVLCLMPAAIVLAWKGYEQLVSPRKSRYLTLLGLIALNIAIKPSFVFLFIPVYPLISLFKNKFSKVFIQDLCLSVAGLLILFLQYWLIYQLGIGDASKESSGLAIAPFYGWKKLVDIPYIPTAIISSLFFPFIYLVKQYKNWVGKPSIEWYLLCMLGVSLSIAICMTETGPRRMDGNFLWQNMVISYLLFLFTSSHLCLDIRTKAQKLFFALWTLHLISGIYYLYRIFSYKDYF